MVNAKTVEQALACDHQIGPDYRTGPVKRRLPRAPKELSVIESGGSTRPVPLFYNGVFAYTLVIILPKQTNKKSLDRRSDLARVIVRHDRSRLEPATQNESRLEPATDQRIVTLVIISTSHLPLNSIPPPCKLPREDMPPKDGTIASYALFETGG